MIRAAIFDLDNTLFPEREYVRSGFGDVASHLSPILGQPRETLVALMMEILENEGRGRIFNRVLERYGAGGTALVPALIATYRNHVPAIDFYGDVEEILHSLRQSGLRIGIVTDGLLIMQERKIAALGLSQLAEVVLCTDSLGSAYWKPHVRPFEEILARLGVKPQEAFYVGDSPEKDVPGPESLGMKTIHLHRDSPPDRCGATFHAPDMFGVLRIIETLRDKKAASQHRTAQAVTR